MTKRATMDTECKFGTQYQPPSNGRPDPALRAHVSNCPECQDQFFLVDRRQGWT